MQLLTPSFCYNWQERCGTDERYYQSIFYPALSTSGITGEAETMSHRGRIDWLISRGNTLWVVECKIDKSGQKSLDQIYQKDYMGRYRHSDQDIKLIGTNFNSKERQVDDWIIESL